MTYKIRRLVHFVNFSESQFHPVSFISGYYNENKLLKERKFTIYIAPKITINSADSRGAGGDQETITIGNTTSY